MSRLLVAVLLAIGTTAGATAAGVALQIELVAPGPSTLRQVFFTDALHGVVAGSKPQAGSALAWTDDGGETWNDATLDTDLSNSEPEGLWMNGQTGWSLHVMLQPRGQVLRKTEDGGKAWKRQSLGELDKAATLGRIWFDADGQRGWINTPGGPIYKTTDGGSTWLPVEVANYEGTLTFGDKPMPGNFTHPGMYVFSADHLMLCGMAGVFVETTDGGATWQARQVPLKLPAGHESAARLSALSFAPEGKSGWAVGGEGDYISNPNGWTQERDPVVLRTTDGGQTWERRTVELRAPLSDVWAQSDQEAWISGPGGYALQNGAPGTLRHTTDGGQTWENVHPGIGALRKLFFLDPTHGWAAGGQGGGMEAASLMVIISTE